MPSLDAVQILVLRGSKVNMTPHVRLGPVVGPRPHSVGHQPLHISPSQCQRTGVADTRCRSPYPIQPRNSVVRCCPCENIRAIASRMHHKVGIVTYYKTRSTSSYPVVAMWGLSLAARLTKKQATAASRNAAFPNPERLKNNCTETSSFSLILNSASWSVSRCWWYECLFDWYRQGVFCAASVPSA
jgi:hypothetical protein